MDPRQLQAHGIDHGGGAGFLEWLFPLLVVALLIAIVGLLIYALASRPEPAAPAPVTPAGSDPVRLAAARLATGDITLDEFDDIRDRVSGSSGEADEGEDGPNT